jgi:hypothetical protein
MTTDQFAMQRPVAGAAAALCFAARFHDTDGVNTVLESLDREELEFLAIFLARLATVLVEGWLDFHNNLGECLDWLRQMAEPQDGEAA